jgi:hypothetical protein
MRNQCCDRKEPRQAWSICDRSAGEAIPVCNTGAWSVQSRVKFLLGHEIGDNSKSTKQPQYGIGSAHHIHARGGDRVHGPGKNFRRYVSALLKATVCDLRSERQMTCVYRVVRPNSPEETRSHRPSFSESILCGSTLIHSSNTEGAGGL